LNIFIQENNTFKLLYTELLIISAGNPTVAYDVAINREFYKKIENNKVFLTFLLTVVMEGLKDKYSLHLQTEGKVCSELRNLTTAVLCKKVYVSQTVMHK